MVKRKVVKKKAVRKKIVRKKVVRGKGIGSGVKRVVRVKGKKDSFVKWMLLGIVLTLPSLFWAGAVRGTVWYDVFGVLALVGLIMAVYNFIKILIKRKRRIDLN